MPSADCLCGINLIYIWGKHKAAIINIFVKCLCVLGEVLLIVMNTRSVITILSTFPSSMKYLSVFHCFGFTVCIFIGSPLISTSFPDAADSCFGSFFLPVDTTWPAPNGRQTQLVTRRWTRWSILLKRDTFPSRDGEDQNRAKRRLDIELTFIRDMTPNKS